MAKISRTFRISENVNGQLTKLSESFRESGGEIVERAIQLLFANSEQELDKANQARMDSLKGK